MQAFSLIAVSAEAIAIAVLLAEWFVSRGSRFLWLLAVASFAGAAAANIVTWTTYSAYYRKTDFCSDNEPSLKEGDWDLNWAFGIRLVELGFLALLAILAVINMGRGAHDRNALNTATLLIALVVLLMTIITTSGRGWIKNTNDSSVDAEAGLWNVCQCRQNYHLDCDKAKKRMRAIETFSVVSIVVQFVLVYLLLRGTPTLRTLNLQRIIAALNFGAMLITMAIFAEYATTVMCGQPRITDTQRFHWAFAIETVAFIAQTLLFVFLMAMPVVPEEEKKSTEPAPSA